MINIKVNSGSNEIATWNVKLLRGVIKKLKFGPSFHSNTVSAPGAST
jgi:hypothetical protein